MKQFSDVPDFDRGFDEMRRHMDETFDEVFKLFGANNIPFFDPYIPPHDGMLMPSVTKVQLHSSKVLISATS